MATVGLPSRVAQPLRILQRLQGPLSVWRRTFLPALATLPLLSDARMSSPLFTLPNSLSSMLASLLELFPSIVLAVPKSKVSHSRKSMRSANKGLHDKLNIVCCAGCGKPKLSHNLCPNCYSQISRTYKQATRQAKAEPVQARVATPIDD